MPQYMDIHFLGDGFTLEGARKAHLRDMAVQEKYGVMYHQYWVNEEAGTAYCLMEALIKTHVLHLKEKPMDLRRVRS